MARSDPSVLVSILLVLLPLLTVAEAGLVKSEKFPIVVSTWPFVEAVRAAWRAVDNGSSAVEAVVEGCSACEELRCDGTVGPGGSPDENGETMIDALVMDGVTMEVGAVAAMRYVKDGIRAARLVMKYSQHTLLAGEGASAFAISMGLPGPMNLSSPESVKKWSDWREKRCQPNFRKNVVPANDCGPYKPNIGAMDASGVKRTGSCEMGTTEYKPPLVGPHNHDTISMAVIDKMGHIAVGTSTNGATFKIPGRVGDGPIAGSSSYADDEVGGCGATGDGDIMMRFLPCYQVVESMRQGMKPEQAAKDAMSRIARKFPDFVGAVVAVDKNGSHAGACHGWTFQYSVQNPDMDDVQVFTVLPETGKTMEVKNVARTLSEHLSQSPPPVIAVAINGKKKSKYVAFWALEKFVPEGFSDFKLLYVRPPVTYIPTPMGNAISVTELRDDVVSAYKQEVDWNTDEMLRPYKKLFERRKVRVEVLVLESHEPVAAIAEEIAGTGVTKLVIGMSLRGFFSRKIDMSSLIATAVPRFCTVYVVSKGKLASVRPSDSDGSIRFERTERSSSTSGSTDSPRPPSEYQDFLSFVSEAQSRVSPSFPAPKYMAFPEMSSSAAVQMETSSSETDQAEVLSKGRGMEIVQSGYEGKNNKDESFSASFPMGTEAYHAMSWASKWRDHEDRREIMSSSSSNNHELANMDWGAVVPDNYSWASHHASNMSEGLLSVHSMTDNQVNLSFEIEKLRAELKHVQEMYAMAQTETVDASKKLTELNQLRFEETEKLVELREKEEVAKDTASQEKKRYEEAMKEAEKVKELMMKEALHRREAEIKAERDTKEKDKLQASLVSPGIQYQHYSWEEITAATSNFSEDLKIGMGAYGTVYKCTLHHTTGAVKVLHAGETQLSKQFDQELEILSKIRHPHLVLLLGACPERGCLVYEYMDNGSLDDRLMLVNDTPPIPWFERFRIALEVASALVFLHKSKPRPIIHRDLKPGNILLDHNYVSKLGDVGLSTMVNQDDAASKLTVFKKTSPVGTLCYIDPEYQRTGIISPKSDVYSLGVVILQLITAKPAIAITHLVEEAIGDDAEFMALLDVKAGSWPISETRELAALGLCCTELRRRDRPDLKDQIIPALERLRKVVDKAQNSLSRTLSGPPSHFICPLLKGVMNEPCVAADGYTYDREAIEEWLREKDTSPVTNLPLPNKNLLANYTLYSAITEWKSNKQ